MSWMLGFLIPICGSYLLWSARRFGPLSPGFIFILVNGVAAWSVLVALDPTVDADGKHGWIIFYSLIAFCVVSFLVESGIPAYEHRPVAVWKPGGTARTLLVLSIVITAAYFAAVGYSALLVGLKAQISGSDQDIASLRLDSYSGSRYLFPGYVNQFKNILLPGLSVVGLIWWSRGGRRLALAIALVAISIFSLLGTAQRGAFVLFGATFLTFTALRTGRILTRRTVVATVAVFGVLMLGTFALGRQAQDVQAASGTTGKAGALLSQVVDRATSQGANGTIGGFRYIDAAPPHRLGGDWIQSVEGLLPGSTGSPLPQQIFQYLWGGRGNSPPSIWASIYYNFGIGGIAVAPIVLALGIAWLNRRRIMSLRSTNTLAAFGIAGTCVCVGFWNAGSPVVLLNTGLVPFLLMWWAGNRMLRVTDDTTSPMTMVASR